MLSTIKTPEKFEEQLIGAKYIKNHFGPTPIAFVKIVKEMEKDGDLAPVIKKYFQLLIPSDRFENLEMFLF